MCGIAAFSVPSGTNVNARLLAHHLLTQIENRGNHASGFAWYTEDGRFGVYKQPMPGSQLPLAELPRNAKTVILHTRYATQGDRMDNRNNHPVLSTDNQIALVHNGVISNDYRLRGPLGITSEEHGEVDSLVIPSMIAQHGVKGLSGLSGYAAIAWLDKAENGLLNIAKLKSSPVAYTHLRNGTFVMASQSSLLELALLNIDAEYGGVFDLPEGRMLKVDGGFIIDHERAPSMSYDYQAYNRHSNATSGGHGKTDRTVSTLGQPKSATGSEDATRESTKDGVKVTSFLPDGTIVERHYGSIDEELADWRKQRAEANMAEATVDSDGKAMVLFDDPEGEWDYSDVGAPDAVTDKWDEIVARMEAEEIAANMKDEGFYLLDHEGDISHYPTLEDLESRLAWLAKMTRDAADPFPGADDKVYWVNYVRDLGSVQKGGVLESWVEDSADIDNFESPAVRNLNYIREGVGHLSTLRGA